MRARILSLTDSKALKAQLVETQPTRVVHPVEEARI